MSFVKTPTSSLTGDPTSRVSPFIHSSRRANTATATELIAKKLWYRTKASVKRCFRRGVLETPTSPSSPITNLPQELVDAIISHLIHDTRTLRACSMICYSWYIAAVPHLHHSLTTYRPIHPGEERYLWPNPLQKSYNLGLLPLVKRFRIRLYDDSPKLTPERLCGRTLRYFSALTNLQELGMDYFDICIFMPNIQQYFGHLAPTLRLLALKDPKGSWRQILYFIGLFPNLQDFKLLYSMPRNGQDGTADPDLVPLSVPPLQGWLTLGYLVGDGLVKDMISLFGGLRFRSMDLLGVECVRLLLDACGETLETLRLYPTDMYGEDFLARKIKEWAQVCG